MPALLHTLRPAITVLAVTATAAFSAPSFADLVQFELSGRVVLFNEDTPMPGVGFGTRASISFVVDTNCTIGTDGTGYFFNDDGPDPTLAMWSLYGATFRSVSAQIGPNAFQADLASGQVFFQDWSEPDASYLLSMNVVVNPDAPDWWVAWVPQAPYDGEIRESEVLAPDGFTRMLAHFDEPPLTLTTFSTAAGNDISIDVKKWRVRVLKDSTAAQPCAV